MSIGMAGLITVVSTLPGNNAKHIEAFKKIIYGMNKMTKAAP